jgi:hypothetical protein
MRLAIGRILSLASQIGIVVTFLGGQFQGRNGRDPFGIFDLFSHLGDALGDRRTLTVQPSDLE